MSENNLKSAAAEVVTAEAGIEKVLAEPVPGVIDTNEPSDADNPSPEAIIETRFAREHDCAFVATDFQQLKEQLQQALFDEAARKKQLEAAREVTARYFDKEKNIATVNAMIEAVIEK